MASHRGSEDFESGLDYGAFVEDDDADRTQALPRTGATASGAHADTQRTTSLSAEDLAGLRERDAGGTGSSAAPTGGEDIVASRPVAAPAAAPAARVHPADRYPEDLRGSGAATFAAPAGAAAGATAAGRADGRTPEEVARLPQAGPRVAQVLLAILAPLVLLLGAVRLVATPLFLWLEYHRPGFPADPYGLTTQDRTHYGSAGLDYLHNFAGPRYLSSLTHQGAPLFTDAEVAHMSDVKAVMMVASVALVVLALVCIALMVHLHRTSPGGIRRALFAGAVWFLVAVVALAVTAALGWSTFFAGFHSLFFRDGTWTFRLTDSLIRLYPSQFWLDAALAVALICLVGALLALVLTWPARRRREMAQDRRAQLEATRLRWAREDAYGQR